MLEEALSGAHASINGRYPKTGFAVNQISKELVYIVKGTGKIVTKTLILHFKEGDSIFIDSGEVFYWKGNFEMYMVTTPKFDPKQHKILT